MIVLTAVAVGDLCGQLNAFGARELALDALRFETG
jgi:hypothetical protein